MHFCFQDKCKRQGKLVKNMLAHIQAGLPLQIVLALETLRARHISSLNALQDIESIYTSCWLAPVQEPYLLAQKGWD